MQTLSLIVPVYNEEGNLPILVEAIQKALGSLVYLWEVVFVDDGSVDNREFTGDWQNG
jgi:glycosyltransferase involved in cell wall biosynthesis